ncbi:RND family efflux transporter MFP subunit [Duganella sp. SG902]|uniref:efflux RND transporter periplasmic adaptor subunit n=1 Tax=Duganella sp. SG902 TaxID=2587016 RepID=UPI00159E0C77|nr:efflux RND transporter periplasmic adaptor subunit [Duganella sp. SG902]NVM77522.1 RND family efflux transporter MFP subunit [Duganella sp. SG902]
MKIRLPSPQAAALAIAAILLSACQPHVDAPPVTRAVKLETIGQGAGNGARFIATVRQRQRAELSFDSGGRIVELSADVGDQVRKGQVLARLDAEPARLRLQQAEANLAAAAAQLGERENLLRQQQALFDDGAASQATLTSARSARDAAQAQLQAARAESAQAARALRRTALRAPFAGRVVARQAQPEAEVGPGQTLLQVEGEGHAQATAALPSQLAGGLRPGDQLTASDSDGNQLTLRVRGLSPRLEHGALITVLFDLPSASSALRSDQSLQLSLPSTGDEGLSVPLSAMVQHQPGDTAQLFIYQADGGLVRRRTVRLGAIQGERVALRAGVRPGEQVVASGAAFLNDGQKVVPLAATSHLADGGAP